MCVSSESVGPCVVGQRRIYRAFSRNYSDRVRRRQILSVVNSSSGPIAATDIVTPRQNRSVSTKTIKRSVTRGLPRPMHKSVHRISRYVSYACAEAGQQLRALIAVAEHEPFAIPDQAERFSSSSCLAVFDVTTKPWRLLRASVAMLWLTIPMTSPFRLNMCPPELLASMVASAWKNSARGMVRYAVLGAQRALMEPTLSE